MRSRAPIVNFSFFRSRSFLGSNLVAFFVTFAMFSQFFFLTLYLQNVLHYSPLQVGLRFLPSTVLIIIAGPIAGRLADRVGTAPADDARTIDRLRRALHPVRDHGGQRLRPAAAGLRDDGDRDGTRDVPDEHRGHERGRPHQGGRGVRHAVDEPHDRGHVRRRRDGRARRRDRPLEPRLEPPPGVRRGPARRSPTRSAPAEPSRAPTSRITSSPRPTTHSSRRSEPA